ncbi:MAG: DUF3806 domain-containing protein [Pseudomonadota bacterium]
MEIRPLNEEEHSALNDGLKLAARYVDDELPLSLDQVQSLYDVICQNHSENLEAQIAVGLAFGQTIASVTDYEWVRVKDEYGEETALSPAGLKAACHPISILQKRIAKKEQVNLGELRDGVIRIIESRRAEGAFDHR